LRFDDSLSTVLSADMDSGVGARSAWRQLIDLIGRGRAQPDAAAMARLRALRANVPVEVRAASGRALAFATPPAALVRFLAEDVLAVSAPVLRIATLDAEDWLAMLPALTPEARAVLRHRRDLPAAVVRGLEAFNPVDFVLPDETGASTPSPAAAPVPSSSVIQIASFRASEPVEAIAEAVPPIDLTPAPDGGYHIADVVARIDAFQRQRDEIAPEASTVTVPTAFRFETDAAGMIRTVDGVARGPLIGVLLGRAATQGLVGVDAVIAGAFRQRQRFNAARIDIGGGSDAAGTWRVAGTPSFDPASGRFVGYAGIARRPRADEDVAPSRRMASDSLRQLVHELRTPTNAIAGFAELIEAQLLGPVSDVYRGHAGTIHAQAMRLVAAIDDLDTAARIEAHALDLKAEAVDLAALLDRVVEDLMPLAATRRTGFDIHPMAADHIAVVDSRGVERLVSRLLAALAASASPGERIDIAEAPAADGEVALCFARPIALGTGDADDTLSMLDIEGDDGGEDGALLGVGFGLRLARNLARELGGTLVFGDHLLTLRLPAVVTGHMERATIGS
jgi:signal transduction histidine kinase